MRRVIYFILFIYFFSERAARGGGGGAARLFLFLFSPCSADHERDWPPCKVVFFGLATNALNVRNNNNNNRLLYSSSTLYVNNSVTVRVCVCATCSLLGTPKLSVVIMWNQTLYGFKEKSEHT